MSKGAKPTNIKLTNKENKISKLIAKDLKKENIFFAGIDFIDQAKRQKNKKKEQDKKKFLISMIENGETKKTLMLQKILNQSLGSKVRQTEHLY